ncbi:MAG: glycosyltransferase, partial [Candidatus Aminicenantes bacterium]|nr:glycosyltransferase [Candidatus Aminicenantes bacterium]
SQRGFPERKLVVIHNGIETDRFFTDLEARARIRAQWGVREGEKLIGIVARFDPMKDHVTFIRAAALLSNQRPDVRFVCVGNGQEPYKSELYSLSHKLSLDDKLIWVGAREDMPSVYNALDIAVSSSYEEGFPNVIVEAMACGVPCVVTDVGDSAMIVGNEGVVVPPRDSDALLAGLSQAMNRVKPDRSFLNAYVKDRFSCDLLIKKTEELLLMIRDRN